MRKQPEPKAYEEQLTYLEKLLARANAQVLDRMAPAEDEHNELTDGLKTDEEETWKRKSSMTEALSARAMPGGPLASCQFCQL